MTGEAPISRRGRWKRVGERIYLCGTLGSEFDAWQRRLAAVSAADAFESQQLGLAEVEKLMDSLETEARESLAEGESLSPRKSPGYADMPLSFSATIIRELDATRSLGVSMTASGLLVPSKTVTAVCEITK